MAAYNRYKANTEYATRWLCTENLQIVTKKDRKLAYECPNSRNCTTRQIIECAARIASDAPKRINDDILRCLDRVILDRGQLLVVFRELPVDQRSNDWEQSNQRHLHFNHVVSVARDILASAFKSPPQPSGPINDPSQINFPNLTLDDNNDHDEDEDDEPEIPRAHASVADKTMHQELEDPHVKYVFDFISSLEDIQSLCDEAKDALAKYTRGEVGFYTAVNTLRAVGEYYSTRVDIKGNPVAQAAVRNEEFRHRLVSDFPQLHRLLGEDGHRVALYLNELALESVSTVDLPQHLEQNDFARKMLDRAPLLKEFGDGVIESKQFFAAIGIRKDDPGRFYQHDTLSYYTLACAVSDFFSREHLGPPRYVSFTIEMLMHEGIGNAMAAGALNEANILLRDIEATCQTLRGHRKLWEEDKELSPTCPPLDTILERIGELAAMLERKTLDGRSGWNIRYAGGKRFFFVPDAVTEVMPMLLGYHLSLLRAEFCKRTIHLLFNRNMQMPYIAHLYRMLRGMQRMKHEWTDLEFVIARQSLLLSPNDKEALPACPQTLPYKERVDFFVGRTPGNRKQGFGYDDANIVYVGADCQPNESASEHLYLFESPRKYFCAPREVIAAVCKESLDTLLDRAALQKLPTQSLRTYIDGERFSRREVFQQIIRNFEDEEPHMRFDYAGFLMFSLELLSSEVKAVARKEPIRCALIPTYPHLSRKLEMFISGVRYWTSSVSRTKTEEAYLQAHQLLWTLGERLDRHFDRNPKTVDNFMRSSQSAFRE